MGRSHRAFCVRAHAEAAVHLAQVNGEEAGNERVLAHQGFGVGGVLGNVLCQVFHQLDSAVEQVSDVGRSGGAHFSQIVFQVLADRITLEVIVVEREKAEGEYHDQ